MMAIQNTLNCRQSSLILNPEGKGGGMGTGIEKASEPGRYSVEIRMPAWLALAAWIWISLLATAFLIYTRIT